MVGVYVQQHSEPFASPSASSSSNYSSSAGVGVEDAAVGAVFTPPASPVAVVWFSPDQQQQQQRESNRKEEGELIPMNECSAVTSANDITPEKKIYAMRDHSLKDSHNEEAETIKPTGEAIASGPLPHRHYEPSSPRPTALHHITPSTTTITTTTTPPCTTPLTLPSAVQSAPKSSPSLSVDLATAHTVEEAIHDSSSVSHTLQSFSNHAYENASNSELAAVAVNHSTSPYHEKNNGFALNTVDDTTAAHHEYPTASKVDSGKVSTEKCITTEVMVPHRTETTSATMKNGGRALKALSPTALLDMAPSSTSITSTTKAAAAAGAGATTVMISPGGSSSPPAAVPSPPSARRNRYRTQHHHSSYQFRQLRTRADAVKSGVRLNPYVRCVQRSSSVPQIRSLTQLLYDSPSSGSAVGISPTALSGRREILPAEVDTPCHSLSSYPAGVAAAILQQQQQLQQQQRCLTGSPPPQLCGVTGSPATTSLSCTTPFSSVSSSMRMMSPSRGGGGGGLPGGVEDGALLGTCTPRHPMTFSPLPQSTAGGADQAALAALGASLPHQQHLLASASTTSMERLPLSSPVEENGLLFTPLMSGYGGGGTTTDNERSSQPSPVHRHVSRHHHQSNSAVSVLSSHDPRFTTEGVTTPHTYKTLLRDGRRRHHHHHHPHRYYYLQQPHTPSMSSAHYRHLTHLSRSSADRLQNNNSSQNHGNNSNTSGPSSFTTTVTINAAHQQCVTDELADGEVCASTMMLFNSPGIGIGVGGECLVTPSSSGYFTTPEIEPVAHGGGGIIMSANSGIPTPVVAGGTTTHLPTSVGGGTGGGGYNSGYTSATFTPSTLSSTLSTPTAAGMMKNQFQHYPYRLPMQQQQPQRHSMYSLPDSRRTSSALHGGAPTPTLFGNLLLPPTTAAAAAAEVQQKEEREEQVVESTRALSANMEDGANKGESKQLEEELNRRKSVPGKGNEGSREELSDAALTPTTVNATITSTTTNTTVHTIQSNNSIGTEPWPSVGNTANKTPPPTVDSTTSTTTTGTTPTTTPTSTPPPNNGSGGGGSGGRRTHGDGNPVNSNGGGAFVMRQRPLIPRSHPHVRSRSSAMQEQMEKLCHLQRAAPPHPPPMLGGASSYHYILRNFSGGTFQYYKSEAAKTEFLEVCHRVLSQVRGVLEQETLHPQVGLFPQISAPAYIFGDIHGNFEDLSFFLRRVLLFNDFSLTPANMICLGDYVDRGAFSLECVMLLFSLKVMNPAKLVMLRGNHEDRAVCGDLRTYGNTCFASQCQRVFGFRRGTELFREVTDVFRYLPLAAELVIPPHPHAILQSCGGGPDSTGITRMFMSYPSSYPLPTPPPPPPAPPLMMAEDLERRHQGSGEEGADMHLSCSLVQADGSQVPVLPRDQATMRGSSVATAAALDAACCYPPYCPPYVYPPPHPGMMMSSMGSRILCTHGGIPRFTADPLEQNALGMLRHLQYPRLLTLFPQHATVRDRPETAANYFHRDLLPGLLQKYPAYARLWVNEHPVDGAGPHPQGSNAPAETRETPASSQLLCRPMTEEQLRQAWFSMFDLLWSDPMDVDGDEDEDKEREEGEEECDEADGRRALTADVSATSHRHPRDSCGGHRRRRRDASLPPPSSEPFRGDEREKSEEENGKREGRQQPMHRGGSAATGASSQAKHGPDGAEVSPPCLLPLVEQSVPHATGGYPSEAADRRPSTTIGSSAAKGASAGCNNNNNNNNNNNRRGGAIDEWGFGTNERGSQVLSFSTKAVETFLRSYGYMMLFRAHQEKAHGLRWSKNNRVLTIFSTSNYLSHGNGAGCVVVSATGEVQMIEKVPE